MRNAPDDAPLGKKIKPSRLQRPWSLSFLTAATTVGAFVLLAVIVRSFLGLQQDPKGCQMSYMWPVFTHFADFDTEHTPFASKYSLYLYREGGVDQDTRVKGVPVIFVPGNAGSYKQVRPIAAEAAQYFQDTLRRDLVALDKGKRPLDFFTVDFNEELSAFHGQTLLDQAEYLNEAVSYILALYHNPARSIREPGLPQPNSVIVIGHSMGGMVARTMPTMPNYQERTVNTIITLSAPHARAPVSFDSKMVKTYHQVNTFWRRSYSAASSRNPLSDVTLVSVAGGGLDTMIPSEYTSLTSLVPDTHGFTVFTSAIPGVWTGMDHLAITWCNQLRKALVKAIFDVVDARRPSQTLVQSERVVALRKRLLTGMESVVQKTVEEEPTTLLTLDHASTNVVSHGERLVLRSLGHKTRAHLMPIPKRPDDGSKFTLLTNQQLGDATNVSLTVLFCSVFPLSEVSGLSMAVSMDSDARSTRLACKNAARDVSPLPASTNESTEAFDDSPSFSYLQYNLDDLADFHFVAVVEGSSYTAPGWLVAEFSSAAESTTTVSRGHHQLLIQGLKHKYPPQKPMMTKLKIPEIHSTLFAYNFRIERGVCPAEMFAPLLRQYIQEPYESKYFVNTRGGNINVHGISPYMPPPLRGKDASEGLSLQLWTDPTCNATVKVSLNVDVLGSAGKLFLRYRTVLAAFPLLVIAIVLRKQFKVYDSTGIFMSFSTSMDVCIRTSLPAIFIALTALGITLSKASKGPLGPTIHPESVPTDLLIDFTVNDFMLGTSDPFFWFLVPLFGCISVGVCIAMNYLILTLSRAMVFIHNLVHTNPPASEPQSPTNPNRRFITTGFLLLLLIMTLIPYQLAYLLLCLIQASTCVRAHAISLREASPETWNFYHYVHSLFMLMLWILPINLPVLLVWMQNLRVRWLIPFEMNANFLAIVPFVLLVEEMGRGRMVRRVTSRYVFITNVLIFLLALYAAVYGVTYAYRLHHGVNLLCAWLWGVNYLGGERKEIRGRDASPGEKETRVWTKEREKERDGGKRT
ncbi:GPI inositol-deacylase-like protein [Piedraia hortae CBS 480.64]|uniref:GPI inositol-deacylase n=1 Tax=Piedraia hortae CBS 480.64 TaxID=1314780 RepID=A0A6A7BYY3_9PEZI|nr:GPI inositol-deacylase-like protein [Piedraia hortae CBS 480.64]